MLGFGRNESGQQQHLHICTFVTAAAAVDSGSNRHSSADVFARSLLLPLPLPFPFPLIDYLFLCPSLSALIRLTVVNAWAAVFSPNNFLQGASIEEPVCVCVCCGQQSKAEVIISLQVRTVYSFLSSALSSSSSSSSVFAISKLPPLI